MLPYVSSLALGIGGLILLTIVALRLVRSVRRFTATASAMGTGWVERSGLLRARTAALGVALRRIRGPGDRPGRVPSGEPAQTGGRP